MFNAKKIARHKFDLCAREIPAGNWVRTVTSDQTVHNNSSLSFSARRRFNISLNRIYWEVINLLYALPVLYLKHNSGTKNSRSAWHVIPAQEVIINFLLFSIVYFTVRLFHIFAFYNKNNELYMTNKNTFICDCFVARIIKGSCDFISSGPSVVRPLSLSLLMNTNSSNLIANLIGQLGIPDKPLILSLTVEFQAKRNPRARCTNRERNNGRGRQKTLHRGRTRVSFE